ncbi:hypothetical protein [Marinicella sp. W31]|uniref:hypothetical protein n=1 Tax=Marinicella sp. W31 TaxID=3023713 RepID=UPI00375636DD
MDWNLNNPYWIACVFFALNLTGLWAYYRAGYWFGVVDEAGNRSSHQGQIVTGAGIVLMVILSVAGWLADLDVLLIAAIALLTLVGFIDDKLDLPKSVRLLTQLISIGLLFYLLGLQQQPVWLVIILAFLTVWWLNLFNFMDGANGMAGLHILACCSWYVLMFQSDSGMEIESLGFLVILSSGAYLLFNFPKAVLFMGDSGSLPFALILASLALTGILSGILSYWQVAVLHAVFISDASYTLMLRMRRKEKFWQPHNTHIYQRFIKIGHPHWLVSLAYAVITVVLGLVAWWMKSMGQWTQMSVVGGIYVILLVIFMKTKQLKR